MRLLATLLPAHGWPVLGRLYWLDARAGAARTTRARTDALLLVAAIVAAIACAEITCVLETGIAGGSPLHRPVPPGSARGLLIGLLRLAWLRRRRVACSSLPES